MLANKNRILVVEDDVNISTLVVYNLQKAGYNCTAVYSGEDASTKLSEEKFHLVVLDIMLPGTNGLELCKKIRSSKKTQFTKILMLTAKGEEQDRILGFELGADDYLVKPFSPKELVLRIKAILKRNEDKGELLIHGELKLDISTHTATLYDNNLKLTVMEFDLLKVLMQNKGNVQTREFLLNEVWDLSPNVTTRTVDTHIKQLRQKLGTYCDKIVTVRKKGYKFINEDSQ